MMRGVHPTIRHVALAVLLAVASQPTSAHAESNATRAVAWAREHGLPHRQIRIDLPGRKATRVFVPVGPAHWESFVSHFTEGKGVIIRQSGLDAEHPVLSFGKAQTITYGSVAQQGAARFLDGTVTLAAEPGGLYLALGLSPEHVAYLKDDLSRTTANDRVFANTSGNGGCMWWLVRAMVSPDLPLTHALGVRQSTAPSNLVRKLIHAGTDDVAVGLAMIPESQHQTTSAQVQQYRQYAQQYRNTANARYVPVYEAVAAQLERQLKLSTHGFEVLGDEELMSVPPGGGAIEAVKR
jgi:hypothetical protein